MAWIGFNGRNYIFCFFQVLKHSSLGFDLWKLCKKLDFASRDRRGRNARIVIKTGFMFEFFGLKFLLLNLFCVENFVKNIVFFGQGSKQIIPVFVLIFRQFPSNIVKFDAILFKKLLIPKLVSGLFCNFFYFLSQSYSV